MQIVDILNQLVPNVWTALTQLCASAVLFFVLYKLGYKPVRKILDTRSEYEQNKLAQADAKVTAKGTVAGTYEMTFTADDFTAESANSYEYLPSTIT